MLPAEHLEPVAVALGWQVLQAVHALWPVRATTDDQNVLAVHFSFYRLQIFTSKAPGLEYIPAGHREHTKPDPLYPPAHEQLTVSELAPAAQDASMPALVSQDLQAVQLNPFPKKPELHRHVTASALLPSTDRKSVV